MKKLDQKLQKVNEEVQDSKTIIKSGNGGNKFKKAFEKMKVDGYEEKDQTIQNV